MKIIAIYGPNGSGKTQYVERLRRQLSSDCVRYIGFRDSYGANTDSAYYLQLRWNQHDIDVETPTVGELLERAYNASGTDTPERRQKQQQLYQLFDMQPFLNRYIITLSSGELRRFQLARTLMAQPQTLIIDNPFIGLDAETREQLRSLLYQLALVNDIDIYLVIARRADIPDYVTETINIETEHNEQPSEVISFRDVTIRYGDRTILNDINWTVKQGEHWVLSGQNGSGKSTLLSLVCGDNPQRYACDIRLFGHQQGEAGVSIWELKQRIGYVSPEMHRSYQHNLPAISVVASGLKDTVGLYVRTTPQEEQQCLWYMRLFGIEQLAQRSFLQLSSGEQRLVLVARAFVKDPDLLILDEPLHGLDDRCRKLVLAMVNAYCQRPSKTLIYVSHYREEWPTCIDHELKLTK